MKNAADQRRICDACGSALDVEMPSGFCPGCLLNTVFETETEIAPGSRISEYELLNEVAAAEWALSIVPGSGVSTASSR